MADGTFSMGLWMSMKFQNFRPSIGALYTYHGWNMIGSSHHTTSVEWIIFTPYRTMDNPPTSPPCDCEVWYTLDQADVVWHANGICNNQIKNDQLLTIGGLPST